MKGKGLLVTNEIFPKRAKILSENIERWGVSNAIVTNHAPAELVPHFSGFFDRIVVDAPCSVEPQFLQVWGAGEKTASAINVFFF
ncbi:hypothetical protein EfmAA96_23280 [Enterococcus faecium]|nr:hypothetical protein EfmAA96_23280 [Enterococcus faecium]